MDRGRIALIGSLALVIVVVWAVVARLAIPALGGTATASMTPPTTPAMSLPTTMPAMTAVPTMAAPTVEPSPDPTVATDAVATSDPTDEPEMPGSPETPEAPTDPRLAYAEFLLRLDTARAEVDDLNETIVVAAEAEDRTTVRTAAVDILQFADRERDWLLSHPPAACYADAHEAAGTMVEAYATVAERAIDWADADPGLETLAALADVLAAADDARAALADLAGRLEAATCTA